MNLKRSQGYHFLILLWGAIALGACTGYALGAKASFLKPIGDIFLNLLLTLVVPLVFFSVASAVSNISDLKKASKIMLSMFSVFIFTSLIAAMFMLLVLKMFPLDLSVHLPLDTPESLRPLNLGEQLVNMFTVSDFMNLFSKNHMLALICFSLLVGAAVASLGEKGKPSHLFLKSGMATFMQAISFVMYAAPLGFFAYFAAMVAEIGPQLMKNYYQVTLIYYAAALLYFAGAFTFYAYLAQRKAGVKIFWANVFLPAATALATCSSAASIPANLQAVKKMRVPEIIYEMVVPLGALIHKDGSVLGGIVKIAFLFSIFHLSFSTPFTLLTAVFVSMLVGTVMGAIPSGGMLGEVLILSVYGFPPQALMMIAAISLIIDPIATMLNVTCNTVSSQMVASLCKRIP